MRSTSVRRLWTVCPCFISSNLLIASWISSIRPDIWSIKTTNKYFLFYPLLRQKNTFVASCKEKTTHFFLLLKRPKDKQTSHTKSLCARVKQQGLLRNGIRRRVAKIHINSVKYRTQYNSLPVLRRCSFFISGTFFSWGRGLGG